MTDQPTQAKNSRGSSLDSGTGEHATGLPGFGTWRSVYFFVIIVFFACVILLKAFEVAFS